MLTMIIQTRSKNYAQLIAFGSSVPTNFNGTLKTHPRLTFPYHTCGIRFHD
ncbi:hypothetical protein SAMN05444955_10633 [Lihuaxuella thermophila]|uniref:Uncharacterized protein n=1 Tax=Lihuaxuella thermophila TaxID=1173111 RepID=A0A1H8DXN1_9BACL|nr:hypothetical protein SAMN05444955_10633 [Lihuaxuella thermophila]